MKFSHYAVAGIAAASFATAAIAGGDAKHQQQSQSPETVKQVQEHLSSQGKQLPVDGKMGPQTQAALKEFQESKGLHASGQLDQQTLAALGIGESSAASGSSATPSAPDSSSGGTAEPQPSAEQPK